jgi:hypothetical protein
VVGDITGRGWCERDVSSSRTQLRGGQLRGAVLECRAFVGRAASGTYSAEFEFEMSEKCQLSTDKCQLSTENCPLSTEKCQLRTEKCQLSTEKCQLGTEKCQFEFEMSGGRRPSTASTQVRSAAGLHPSLQTRLPLRCHCDSGVNSQF